MQRDASDQSLEPSMAVKVSLSDLIPISEFANLFGLPADAVIAAVETQRQRRSDRQAFFTIPQLSERWCCSRATIYALLRASAAKVLNVGQGGKRSKILVPAEAVARLEKIRTDKMI
jgi:hypothetical protein